MVGWQMADAVIDGYPEYATEPRELEAQQRSALFRLAQAIVDSHSTGRRPVQAIVVIGHADKALRKAPNERAAFELKISGDRAESARKLLLSEVRRLAFEAHYSKVMLCVATGLGNLRPVIANAANEAQMRKNRRVEVFLLERQLPPVRCAVR